MDELLQMHSDRLIALDLIVQGIIRSHPAPRAFRAVVTDVLDDFRIERSVWDPASPEAEQCNRVDDLCREYLDLLPDEPTAT